jgi:Uma2 family endonuclease
MTNIITDRSAIAPQGEKRVMLHDLTWGRYQQILKALPETRAAQLTYDQGTLEIVMPPEDYEEDHEYASELISLFIRILVGELGLKLKSIGSTPLDREDLDRGAEPDNAYYIQNQPRVAGRTIDLAVDPPPDLVVDVDITHTDIDKNQLYAAMGVPELWRYNGQHWRIHQLQETTYIEVDHSPTFNWIEKEDLHRFLDQAQQDEITAEMTLCAFVREFIQENPHA